MDSDMATQQERSQIDQLQQNFTQVQQDVALLKQFNTEVTKPALNSINEKLDRLSFYTKVEIDTKLREIQRKRWYENTLSATFGAILTGILMFILNSFMGR